MPRYHVQLDVMVEAEDERSAINHGNNMLCTLRQLDNIADSWPVDEAELHTEEVLDDLQDPGVA